MSTDRIDLHGFDQMISAAATREIYGRREDELEDLVRRASVFVNAVLVMADDKAPSLSWIADAAIVVQNTEQEHER
jgi:RNA processing factor Prp31